MGGVPATLAALLLAASPFTREQPDVRAGNERLQAADPAGALARYAEAERAVGTRPELDFDRGTALLRLGRTAEALAALRSAAERGDDPLASRALQNLGGALDAMGDRDGAIRALADALARDPRNGDARFNLEVLLRRRAEERRSGGSRDEPERREAKAGQRDAQEARRAGSPDDRGDRLEAPAGRPDASRADARAGGAAAPSPRTGEAPGEAPASESAGERGSEGTRGSTGEPASRQDAERLLDAVRARERNLPPGAWRRRETGRRDVDEDW